jgi:two-component system CheB/CheR fusion protein
LDSTLHIRRFTEPVRDLFRITASDEGRLITDFTHQLEYDDLAKDASTVIANLAPIRREIHNRNGGRWYDLRMRAYRTVDDKIDGVVITFVDITERKLMEERLQALVAQSSRQKTS